MLVCALSQIHIRTDVKSINTSVHNIAVLSSYRAYRARMLEMGLYLEVTTTPFQYVASQLEAYNI